MTEPFKFSCPHCDGHITATPEWYGKSTDCPHCQGRFEVPYPAPLADRIGVIPDSGETRTVVMRRPPPRPPGPPVPRPQARPPAPGHAPDEPEAAGEPGKKPWWKLW